MESFYSEDRLMLFQEAQGEGPKGRMGRITLMHLISPPFPLKA